MIRALKAIGKGSNKLEFRVLLLLCSLKVLIEVIDFLLLSPKSEEATLYTNFSRGLVRKDNISLVKVENSVVLAYLEALQLYCNTVRFYYR